MDAAAAAEITVAIAWLLSIAINVTTSASGKNADIDQAAPECPLRGKADIPK